MSAYTSLQGTFNFNKTPLAPTGCKIFINENPETRRIWETHGAGGCYIGPDIYQYRYHQVYVNSTRAELIGDTV